MLQYFNLQQSLWQAYYNVGITEHGWTTHISRYAAKEHATCTTYGRSQKFVEQRLAIINNQLKQIKKGLQEISIQLPQWTGQAQPSVNSNTLYVAIEELISKNQKYLHEEFQYKEMMLKFDIAWIKEYWKQTAVELQALEEVEILRKRISLQRLSPSFDNHVNQSIVPLQTMLSWPIISNEQRAILLSRCSKAVIQYKFDMMTLNILAIEDTIDFFRRSSDGDHQ
ncbi:unnamed protein product [Rotaria socialis]|uniref:Uncharacterized protein n=1 Tax=Rotaria socialis TaxID=392032 RepID=A0A818LYK2_9BILA|nr:unnamed protein product [Rotaria socialis]CAF4835073.1 unnamed protein product [Rotaria socialis]